MATAYRCIIFATFGWLILASAAAGEARKIDPAPARDLIANVSQPVASGLNEVAQVRRQARGCPKGSDDRSSDLCAQWKAADAARDGASYARIANFIGWIGVILGTATMIAASLAAKFAHDAAKYTRAGADEARRAANFAERSVVIAADAFQYDMRPWVSIQADLAGRWYAEPSGSIPLEVRATLVNHGNSPAIQVRSGSKIFVGSPDMEELNRLIYMHRDDESHKIVGSTIFPSQDEPATFRCYVFPVDIQTWIDVNPERAASCPLVATLWVTYSTNGNADVNVTSRMFHLRGVYGDKLEYFFRPDRVPDRIVLEPYHLNLPPS